MDKKETEPVVEKKSGVKEKFMSPKYKNRNARKATHKQIKKAIQTLQDKEQYITNLSSKTLTVPQVDILSLGLTFVPSQCLKPAKLSESLNSFDRNNRLQHFFDDRPSAEPHPFRKKSTWNPPPASPSIQAYLKRVRAEVNSMQPLKIAQNLTPTQNKALKELSSDQTLIIKKADKGSGIVVEDREQYIKDGLDHLSDENIYEKIDRDPTNSLTETINTFVQKMFQEGVIDPPTKEHLTLKTNPPPRTQQMYFLKKIHKNPIGVRPIVSGCGGPTENISQLIDLNLKPHIPKIKSYLKDSSHLISLLESTLIPKNSTLVTIDVKSLYLNIPHREGINAVLNRLYPTQELADQMNIPPNTIVDLLKIVLEHNYFQFADTMYHQVQGTAMGTKMAPSYANIFMAELEEYLLDNYSTKPLLWKRYIDDILCIWPGPPSEVEDFIQYLNPTIKFTHSSSTTEVDFLDLTIYKGKRHAASLILDLKPFFKPTNKFQYLEYSSAHHRGTFPSLIKGELTRLLRACSDERTYKKAADVILSKFKKRGYPNSLLQRILQQVPFQNRTELFNREKEVKQTYDTFFKINYTPDLDTRSLRKILQPHEQ